MSRKPRSATMSLRGPDKAEFRRWGGCRSEVGNSVYPSDLDDAPFGWEQEASAGRQRGLVEVPARAPDVDPDGRENVFAGPRVGIVNRINPALVQRHAGITRHPVDLDVVARSEEHTSELQS